jgi:hypothetical protein
LKSQVLMARALLTEAMFNVVNNGMFYSKYY